MAAQNQTATPAVAIDANQATQISNEIKKHKMETFYLLVQLVVKDSAIFERLNLVTGILSGAFFKVPMKLKDVASTVMSSIKKSALYKQALFTLRSKNKVGKTTADVFNLLVDALQDVMDLLCTQVSEDDEEELRHELDNLLQLFDSIGLEQVPENTDSLLLQWISNGIQLLRDLYENLGDYVLTEQGIELLDRDPNTLTPEEQNLLPAMQKNKTLFDNIQKVLTGLLGFSSVVSCIKSASVEDFKKLAGNAADIFSGDENNIAICFMGISTAVEVLNQSAETLEKMGTISKNASLKDNAKKVKDLTNYMDCLSKMASGDLEKMAKGTLKGLETAQEMLGDGVGENVQNGMEIAENALRDLIPNIKYFYTCVTKPQKILSESVNVLQTKSVHGRIANWGYKRLLLNAMRSSTDARVQICMTTAIDYEWAKYDYELHGFGEASLKKNSDILVPLLRMVEGFEKNNLHTLDGDLFIHQPITELLDKHYICVDNYKDADSKKVIKAEAVETMVAKIEIAYLSAIAYKKLAGQEDAWDIADFKPYFMFFLNKEMERSTPAFQHADAVWKVLEGHMTA